MEHKLHIKASKLLLNGDSIFDYNQPRLRLFPSNNGTGSKLEVTQDLGLRFVGLGIVINGQPFFPTHSQPSFQTNRTCGLFVSNDVFYLIGSDVLMNGAAWTSFVLP